MQHTHIRTLILIFILSFTLHLFFYFSSHFLSPFLVRSFSLPLFTFTRVSCLAGVYRFRSFSFWYNFQFCETNFRISALRKINLIAKRVKCKSTTTTTTVAKTVAATATAARCSSLFSLRFSIFGFCYFVGLHLCYVILFMLYLYLCMLCVCKRTTFLMSFVCGKIACLYKIEWTVVEVMKMSEHEEVNCHCKRMSNRTSKRLHLYSTYKHVCLFLPECVLQISWDIPVIIKLCLCMYECISVCVRVEFSVCRHFLTSTKTNLPCDVCYFIRKYP